MYIIDNKALNTNNDFSRRDILLQPLKDGCVILDLGCGIGSLEELILKSNINFKKIIAIDSNKKAIEEAKSKYTDVRISFYHYDYNNFNEMISSISDEDSNFIKNKKITNIFMLRSLPVCKEHFYVFITTYLSPFLYKSDCVLTVETCNVIERLNINNDIFSVYDFDANISLALTVLDSFFVKAFPLYRIFYIKDFYPPKSLIDFYNENTFYKSLNIEKSKPVPSVWYKY